MTTRLLLLPVLALALACGGADNNPKPDPGPEPWNPPVVDPTRLGVACPAPEVEIMLYDLETRTADFVPAGELQVGDMVYGRAVPFSHPFREATRVDDQQRLRLLLDDGRAPVFTADHVLKVMQCPDGDTVPIPQEVLDGNGYVELQYLVPELCLDGPQWGRVATVENWTDGPVIRISVSVNGGNAGAMYVSDGLFSLSHPFPLE
jgi:hypothetical protein